MQKSNLSLGDDKNKNISQYTEDYINHPIYPNINSYLQKKEKEVILI